MTRRAASAAAASSASSAHPVEEPVEESVGEHGGVHAPGPVSAQRCLERVPRDDGLLEAPRQVVGVADRRRASRGHQQVGPQLSDVEPDRAVERELAVERLGRRATRIAVTAHHHRPGVQVTMDQRLGAGHEVPLGGADGRDHVGIAGVGGDVAVARRRHRATPPGRVWLTEDERLGDLAEWGVDRLSDERFEPLGVDAERGSSEGDVGDVSPERAPPRPCGADRR